MPGKFKVIIVGGSVTGLTLANLFQKLGIDYVVLEAYGSIAPQVGASIGLHPNGLRILDQLDCYEDIRKLAAPAWNFFTRDGDGRQLYSHDVTGQVEARHGYDIFFLERREVLEVLFHHVKEKSRVLVNQRVVNVQDKGDYIEVSTAAGMIFKGDLIVGADGIHSTVRREMWRIANDVEPGYISTPSNEAMRTDYGCIFGISKPTGDIKESEVHLTHKKGVSLAVMAGLGDRLFWFCFFKLPQTHRGITLPTFTKEDEVRIAENERNTPVTTKVTFGQLYDNVETSTTTPLPDHVFKQWHFGRIILLGDSVHKFNPISGQGGNSAIESAAALADRLHIALKKNGNTLSRHQLSSILADTEEFRRARVVELVEASMTAQRVSAWETPSLTFLDKFVASRLDTTAIVDQMSSPVLGAGQSRSLPANNRPHTIPFDDERHLGSQSRTWSLLPITCAYLGLVFSAFYGLGTLPTRYGTLERLDNVVKARAYEGHGQPMLNFDHIPLLGSSMSYLIAVYFPGTESWDRAFQLLTFYLSISEIPIFASWTVESRRPRSAMSLIRFAVLFGCFSNVTAIAIGTPLFYLVDALFARTPSHFWSTAVHVPANQAKSILPAIIVGVLIPTLLMFDPFLGSVMRQYMAILWMFCPIYLYGLQKYFAQSSSVNVDRHPRPSACQESSQSLEYLRWLYGFSFTICALTHLSTVAICLTSNNPQVTLSRTFLFEYHENLSIYQGNHNMFLWDFYITMAGGLLWCLVGISDAKRFASAQVNWWKALLAILVSSVCVGPAATISACCAWREAILLEGWSEKKVVPSSATNTKKVV